MQQGVGSRGHLWMAPDFQIVGLLVLSAFFAGVNSFMLARFGRSLVGRQQRPVLSCANSLQRTLRSTSGKAELDRQSQCKSSFYVTTPIYYVNGDPHLGHAYTSTLADIIARYHRLDGKDAYFLTGTDEHGQKVEQSALKACQAPYDFSTTVSDKFRQMTKMLGCSNDDFIRTTEDRHKAGVEALWKRLENAGQIYLGAYEGWYSVRDEAFYTDLELVNGKAPTGADVEWVREESYFFRLSQWTDKLRAFYEANPDFILPRGKKNELLTFINQEGGLRDLSISRTTFNWGIPVPGNPKHVIYVWLDALANYITALGYPNTDSELFQRHWPASLHVVGKDILRFHGLFWPAFLMAAGIEPPKRIFAHGWWTRDGEKMSKSVGNVLDPFALVEQYGVDYVRYFLAADLPFGNDGDFSHEGFCTRINDDLANDLGNLVQRTVVMVQRHCGGVVPPAEGFTAEDEELLRALQENTDEVRRLLEQQAIKGVCDSVIKLARLGNKYIDAQAPWVLVKTNPERLRTVMYVLMELLRHCGIKLQPVMPQSCARLLTQIGVPEGAEHREFSALTSRSLVGSKSGNPQPVFPKLQPASTSSTTAGASGVGGASTPQNINTPPTHDAEFAKYLSWSAEQVAQRVEEVGQDIRTKKANKVSKKDLEPQVRELLFLKKRLAAVKEGGV